MSDMATKPKPSFAPVYAAMYPSLAAAARAHGYALAVHGSMQRDFDVVAIPWTDDAADPETVIRAITDQFAVELVNDKPSVREHGRIVYSISICFGECALDVSFMPRDDIHLYGKGEPKTFAELQAIHDSRLPYCVRCGVEKIDDPVGCSVYGVGFLEHEWSDSDVICKDQSHD